MTIINLDNPSKTFFFKNLPDGTETTWTYRNGKLFGTPWDRSGIPCGFTVEFPLTTKK